MTEALIYDHVSTPRGKGMMGAGIAYAAARAGIEVVLLDTSPDNAVRGRQYAQDLLDKAVRKGRTTPQQRDATLARITPTVQFADLAGCDLVVEAVFVDRAVEAQVTRKGEAVLRQMCALGRIGRKANLGFYDWTDAGRSLWPGLAQMFPPAARQPARRELIDRLLFVQANEAARGGGEPGGVRRVVPRLRRPQTPPRRN